MGPVLMSDINFYHLQRSTLETVLPKLLEKTRAAGKRALVMASSTKKTDQLANHLWTYDPAGWLPHGSKKDGMPDEQPIWISDDGKAANENLNQADFLFLTDNAQTTDVADFERIFVLFDGNNDYSLEQARAYWKTCDGDGHNLIYWQQNDRGGWDQKTSTIKTPD
jgi:DNA polymerase-3 subunit chi